MNVKTKGNQNLEEKEKWYNRNLADTFLGGNHHKYHVLVQSIKVL